MLDFGKRQRMRPTKAITRQLRPGRALRHAFSCLPARGGRLHRPDDPQADPRQADVTRRATASIAHLAAGLRGTRSRGVGRRDEGFSLSVEPGARDRKGDDSIVRIGPDRARGRRSHSRARSRRRLPIIRALRRSWAAGACLAQPSLSRDETNLTARSRLRASCTRSLSGPARGSTRTGLSPLPSNWTLRRRARCRRRRRSQAADRSDSPTSTAATLKVEVVEARHVAAAGAWGPCGLFGFGSLIGVGRVEPLEEADRAPPLLADAGVVRLLRS